MDKSEISAQDLTVGGRDAYKQYLYSKILFQIDQITQRNPIDLSNTHCIATHRSNTSVGGINKIDLQESAALLLRFANITYNLSPLW